jgi:murein L,D-transpeptidase YcbB/YkuD
MGRCHWARLLARLLALVVGTAGFAVAAAQSAWFVDGRPTPLAREAVELLAAADTHGLEPRDYDAATLADALQQAARRPLDPAAVERLESLLTAAFERYLTDLHAGRIAPQELPHGYAAPMRKPFDAARVLRDAVTKGELVEATRAAAPRLSQYDQLRAALPRYRALAAHPAWAAPLPPVPPAADRGPPKLEPGGRWPGLPRLRDRLIALGDLDPGASAAVTYDSALVDAVKAFQRRHGLTDDGIIGKATLARLQVPPSARARQIELSLERLRWTPLLQGPRMVVVNVPEFVLRAYEVQGDRIVVRETMKIIVGKAMDTRTPLFEEAMRAIEFSPYWNVPPSIARGEVVPRLRRDPAYWQREGFEFVTGGGAVVETLSPALLDATLAGSARIRQRPGPRNALGDIKFVFPNRDNIYLHHTPSVGLFERDRRDFSHGCIRVERPVALAMFVLAGMPDWTEERVRAAMEAGESRTLRLAEPVPVLIAYGTAIVRDGRVHFFDDLYGHDRALDAALRRPRPPLTIDR